MNQAERLKTIKKLNESLTNTAQLDSDILKCENNMRKL